MAISIRNSECERLARYLSDRNGSGMIEEILAALRDRVKKTDTGFSRKERIEKISAECAGYALARTTNKPLIYKGRDFQKTDIPPAPRLQLLAVGSGFKSLQYIAYIVSDRINSISAFHDEMGGNPQGAELSAVGEEVLCFKVK